MLAPEEVYDAGRTSSAFAGDSSELAPNEKRAAHHRRRREKKARNEKIENVRKAYAGEGARPKGGDKAEKEEALKKLVGNKVRLREISFTFFPSLGLLPCPG